MAMPAAQDAIEPFAEFSERLLHVNLEETQERGRSRMNDAAEFERARQHLIKYYEGVEPAGSFVDDAGQIFDCIRFDQQPSVRFVGHLVETPPGVEASHGDQPTPGLDPLDRFGNPQRCPEGYVPVRRLTLAEVARHRTLEHFFGRRRHRRKPSATGGPKPEEAPDAQGDFPHRYATAYQTVASKGASTRISIWQPPLAGGQLMSLAQLWCSAGSEDDNSLQTAEAGWEVCPENFPDAAGQPSLFIFWTRDNYQTTGAYNNRDGSFQLKAGAPPLDAVLNPVSAVGGAQQELSLSYQQIGPDWWLYLNGQAMGCWPGAIYAGGALTAGSAEVMFGGETDGNADYPPMGSGQFAMRGYEQAAYQRDVTYFDVNGQIVNAALLPYQPTPGNYTVDVGHPAAGAADWGAYFYFGGPGGP